MTKYKICRVIGNELPPKDQVGCKLESLKFVLEMDKEIDAEKVWLLNRIIDSTYRNEVRRLLARDEVLEMPFKAHEYLSSPNKIRYLTNINQARNTIIKEAMKSCDLVVSLDQDCFFDRPSWTEIKESIEGDDGLTMFYGLVSKRVTIKEVLNYRSVPDGESMLVFRKGAPFLFDENLNFGEGDKLALLQKLGYEGFSKINGDLCKIAGTVLHVGCDEQIESDWMLRVKLRSEGLQIIKSRADSFLKILM